MALLVLPQQDNIEEWIQAADLLVSGSHEDTEGMSHVLVPERSPADVARAVRQLQTDAPRLARMRDAAVRRARERFDIRLYARGVERCYLDILGRAS